MNQDFQVGQSLQHLGRAYTSVQDQRNLQSRDHTGREQILEPEEELTLGSKYKV